jgi:hypothetical protein
MVRRELLGVLGTTTAGLIAMPAINAYAKQEGAHDQTHAECLKACDDCARECNETFHHCYEQVAMGKKEHAKALRLVADCAKFCDLSASLIASQSPLMIHSCAACAEACKACASECGKFDSAQMTECAKSCHTCEGTCRAMVKAMGGHTHPEN